MKFKKGDFVELTYEGVFQNKIGKVVRIDESYTFSVVVDFGGTRYDRFLPNGKANYLSGIRIKKHYAFTPKQMIDFTNWCISNGLYYCVRVRAWSNKEGISCSLCWLAILQYVN